MSVEKLSDNLFPDSALSGNQQRHICTSDRVDLVANLSHCRRRRQIESLSAEIFNFKVKGPNQ